MVVFVTVTKSETPSIIQNGHFSPDRQWLHEKEKLSMYNMSEYSMCMYLGIREKYTHVCIGYAKFVRVHVCVMSAWRNFALDKRSSVFHFLSLFGLFHSH